MDDLLYFKGYIGQLMLRVILQHSITVFANKFKDLLFFFFAFYSFTFQNLTTKERENTGIFS